MKELMELACASSWFALAKNALDRRLLEEAVAAFDQAEALGADANQCCGERWTASMLAGKFEAAWQQSDRLRMAAYHDPHCLWNGDDIADKQVVVRCLHGFGDAVQMLRYARTLAASAQNVVYEVPPELFHLAKMFEDVETVITWGEEAPDAPMSWDAQIEVMELPYIFRTVETDLPLVVEYLHVPSTLKTNIRVALEAKRPASRRDQRPRVGVMWTAGEWTPTRTIPIETMGPLLDQDCCEWWSLHRQTIPRDLEGKLYDGNLVGEGIVALAGLIANLDLVITVDTLAAHLAGAIGKPAWVMLQKGADWRWMVDRTDTPWYPTLQLFRQSSQGDWHSVISQVQGRLAQFAQEFHYRRSRGHHR